jgi:hypothetical protein
MFGHTSIRANQSLPLVLNAACLAANTYLTLLEFETMIYITRGKHTNHYTTYVALKCN